MSLQIDCTENPSFSGASDLELSTLFTSICQTLPAAKVGPSLTTLRRLLTDINFELGKYSGGISLSAESWRPRLDHLLDFVLPSIQIQPLFLLEIKDVERDVVSLVDQLTNLLAASDGVSDKLHHINWHLNFAQKCTLISSMPRVRAYGYWKIGDLRKGIEIDSDSIKAFLPTIVSVVDGFRDDDCAVAKSASDAILSLVQHFKIANILQPTFEFSKRLSDVIGSTTRSGSKDVVKFRIFEFVQELLQLDLVSVADLIQLGAMEYLYSSFRTMDLLVMANCCETLNAFAGFNQGLQLLEESGGIKLAEDLLCDKKDSFRDPNYGYFAPYLFRMFTTIAVKFPEYCIVKREKITLLTQELILNVGDHSGAAALEYLGQFASSSVAGKRYLSNLAAPNGSSLMDPVLRFIGAVLNENRSTSLPPINEECFRAMALLIKRLSPSSLETDVELQVINQGWFVKTGGVFPSLFQKARNPFKDAKIPSLLILKEMASQKWGQEQFRDEPGFMEFLLHRQVTSDKETKEIKYEIIKAVIVSSCFLEVFDSLTTIRMREYVQDGPFYVHAEHQVASESQ